MRPAACLIDTCKVEPPTWGRLCWHVFCLCLNTILGADNSIRNIFCEDTVLGGPTLCIYNPVTMGKAEGVDITKCPLCTGNKK